MSCKCWLIMFGAQCSPFFSGICWLTFVLGLGKILPNLVFPQTPKPHTATPSPPLPLSLRAALGWGGELEAQKAKIGTMYWKQQCGKKMNSSSNNINNKSVQKEECGARPHCSHVPSGSGAAFPPLWPKGNDLRWYGTTLGSWPCPCPSYCKKLTLPWLEPGHTFKEVKPRYVVKLTYLENLWLFPSLCRGLFCDKF